MTLTSVLASLQLAATLLMGIQNNPHATNADAAQAITQSSQAIQQGVQLVVMPRINFPFPRNNSIWPNITDLRNTAYISPDGGYVPLGNTVALVGEDTSFGDVNGDGVDDAAVVVKRIHNNGTVTTDLAAMLNQNSIMFNIADTQLGDNIQILSHHIVEGGDIILNTQTDTGAVQTSTYRLLGSQLIKL